MKLLTPFLLSFLFLACSPQKHVEHAPPKPTFKVKSIFDSCKFETIKTVPMLVSVAFFKDCSIEKVRVYGIVVYDADSMQLAGVKAAQIIKEHLGYQPTLGLVSKFMIADKYLVNYPFLIFVETGRVTNE